MARRGKDSSTLTSKGQITLPKAVRERLGVRTGDRIRFRETAEGTVVVEPETGDVMDLFASLEPARGRRLTVEQMGDAIRRAGVRSGKGT